MGGEGAYIHKALGGPTPTILQILPELMQGIFHA